MMHFLCFFFWDDRNAKHLGCVSLNLIVWHCCPASGETVVTGLVTTVPMAAIIRSCARKVRVRGLGLRPLEVEGSGWGVAARLMIEELT